MFKILDSVQKHNVLDILSLGIVIISHDDHTFKPILSDLIGHSRRHRGGDAFPRITRVRIARSSRNLSYLSFEQFYTFPENFESVPTMTFDL